MSPRSPHSFTFLRRSAERVLMVALLALVPACQTCETGVGDAGPGAAAGFVRIRQPLAGGDLEVRLLQLARPLRAISMRVTVGGALAVSVEAAGDIHHDVIDAALDAPRSGFTLVVSDTRRLPLTDGAIARVLTDGAPTSVTLESIDAVDLDGRRVTLEVDTQ